MPGAMKTAPTTLSRRNVKSELWNFALCLFCPLRLCVTKSVFHLRPSVAQNPRIQPGFKASQPCPTLPKRGTPPPLELSLAPLSQQPQRILFQRLPPLKPKIFDLNSRVKNAVSRAIYNVKKVFCSTIRLAVPTARFVTYHFSLVTCFIILHSHFLK
jgi:hypothetical protein